MNSDAGWLIDLLKRAPIIVLGNAEVLKLPEYRAYANAIAAWRREAELAVREAEAGRPAPYPDKPDAVARLASVLSLARVDAVE